MIGGVKSCLASSATAWCLAVGDWHFPIGPSSPGNMHCLPFPIKPSSAELFQGLRVKFRVYHCVSSPRPNVLFTTCQTKDQLMHIMCSFISYSPTMDFFFFNFWHLVPLWVSRVLADNQTITEVANIHKLQKSSPIWQLHLWREQKLFISVFDFCLYIYDSLIFCW